MGKPEISTTEKQRFQQKLKICIFLSVSATVANCNLYRGT